MDKSCAASNFLPEGTSEILNDYSQLYVVSLNEPKPILKMPVKFASMSSNIVKFLCSVDGASYLVISNPSVIKAADEVDRE